LGASEIGEEKWIFHFSWFWLSMGNSISWYQIDSVKHVWRRKRRLLMFAMEVFLHKLHRTYDAASNVDGFHVYKVIKAIKSLKFSPNFSKQFLIISTRSFSFSFISSFIISSWVHFFHHNFSSFSFVSILTSKKKRNETFFCGSLKLSSWLSAFFPWEHFSLKAFLWWTVEFRVSWNFSSHHRFLISPFFR
jgi:hypothetical protein